MGMLIAALGCVGGTDLLLHVEPSNRQAHSLKGLIDQAETREGYIGASSPTSLSSPPTSKPNPQREMRELTVVTGIMNLGGR